MSVLGQKSDKKIDKPHILVVDDDERIRDLVSRYLSEHDFVVMTAEHAADADEVLSRFSFDVLVVDVMMPGRTGVVFTQDLRKADCDVPVLLLTALGEAQDRVAGFEAGADDYLPKPFEPKELVLRLQSILRRTKKDVATSDIFKIGKWRFDPGQDVLEANDEVQRLTSVEAQLLRVLAQSLGDVLSREVLADRCSLDSGGRAIDVQVTRLRRKIEENTKVPRHLQTVRGKGYVLRAEKE